MENIIETCLRIALEAHQGQKDKAGKEYIQHPLRIMSKCKNTLQKAVAILHDVIEDSSLTIEDLIYAKIPCDVINAVDYLTKKEGQSLDEYFILISSNNLATSVKLLDLEDNMNMLRLDTLTQKDLSRLQRYHHYYQFLKYPKD